MTTALERGGWSAARPGRTLPPRNTQYPFCRRLGGPQGRSGRAENLAPTGIRSPDRPSRSQSLYRLSYPAHVYTGYFILSAMCLLSLPAAISPRSLLYINTTNGPTGSDKLYLSYKIKARGKVMANYPPRTCPGRSVPEPHRSHDWALVPASPAPKAEY